jgi:hypothetical protein
LWNVEDDAEMVSDDKEMAIDDMDHYTEVRK